MSTPGRKPKPTAVKKLQGNPGKRKLAGREPKPKTAVKRPYGLGKGLQDRFWKEHADELARLQILTGIDVAAFRLMAEHYAFAVQAAQQLREEGLTVEGREGPKKNPLAQIFRDNSMAYKSFAEQFGMTPSARTRLQIDLQPDEGEQLSLVDALFAAVQQAESE
jgi:P27 family predicted phage terminase small subunit